MVRHTGRCTLNLALAPNFWTSSRVEISAAIGAPRTVKQRCFLLHSTVGSIQQQRGSELVIEGCRIDAVSGQHDSQVGEPGEVFLELAHGGVLLHNPSEKPLILGDLSCYSKYFGVKALPLASFMFWNHRTFVGEVAKADMWREAWSELTVCW